MKSSGDFTQVLDSIFIKITFLVHLKQKHRVRYTAADPWDITD